MSLAYKQYSNSSSSEILHKRIRIYVHYIYKNQEKALEIEQVTSNIHGVKYCKANSFTGNLLILYDDETTNELIIKRQIYRYISNKILTNNNIDSKDDLIKNEEKKTKNRVPIAVYNKKRSIQYHSLEASAIEKQLATNYSYGLSKAQVNERVKELGLNVISETKKKSLIRKIIDHVNEFSTKLLVGVGLLSFALGQFADGIAILGIAAIDTILSTLQQHKAEKSLYSLKEMMIQNARVIRNGKQCVIDAKILVPGDIIIVEAGEKVPADARLIECSDLKTSEASLTGESIPVCKSVDICNKDSELADRYNMIYMGTDVLSGRGKAVVVSTGLNTEIGKIAYMIQNIKPECAPLETKINKLVNKIIKFAIGVCMSVSALGLLKGASLVQVFILGVSFSLGSMPEGLPAIVTAAMALSVQKLTAKNVIVRKLPAVETLGSANVICCDKTGTLTMNQMTAREIYVDNSTYELTGLGYNPNGEILRQSEEANSTDGTDGLDKIITAGVLCNNSNLIHCEEGWTIHGDPTEGALLTAAYKNKTNVEELLNQYKRIKEIPFDSSRRYMTVMVTNHNETYAYCKGSVSKIMDKCTMIYENGKERLFTSTDRETIQSNAHKMGSKALRVLAICYKKISKENKNIDNNFIFLGLVGMEDPPRDGVKESIEKCRTAGIKVVMITGDNKNTASAIGKKIGLLTDGIVLSGSELENMSDDQLFSIINTIQIFARTSPEQKYRIVKAFKRAGNVVAMTGDGVNDTPAIKEADIGIAIGQNCSDIVRDTADIILTDDNFAAIVAAIEEGRAVNLKIKNSIKYLLSGNLSELMAISIATIFTGISPLLSLQILWINVIAETILGASITFEEAPGDLMNRPPISKDADILDNTLKKQILRRGFTIGLSTFSLFNGSLLFGLGLQKARTLAFTNIILSQVVNIFDCKINKRSRNRYMNTASTACVTLLGGILYIPFFSSFFSTVPLNITDILLLSGTATLAKV